MVKNYLKITLRNLYKNKVFSLINILGLSIGFTACLLIIQYVYFEKSYDKFHEGYKNIYRIRQDRIYSDRHDKTAGSTAALGPTLKEEFIEVEDFTKLWGTGQMNNIISFGDKTFREEELYFADSSFLNLFSYQLLYGDPTTALANSHSIVLTRSVAEKYFGNADPLGKHLHYTNSWESADFVVTGVLEDLPANTHIKFRILVSFETLSQYTEGGAKGSWGWNAFPTYLKLRDGTTASELEGKLKPFIEKYYAQRIAQGVATRLILQPLKDIHLYSDLRFEFEKNGNARAIYFLLIIAIIIVVIAWVNYTNLSAVRIFDRAREVGIRKASGASKNEIMTQFFLESVLINLISLGIAFTLIQLFLPSFIALTGKNIDTSYFSNPLIYLSSVVLILLGAILSGIYPAKILSKYKPSQVLKSRVIRKVKGINLRRGLVVLQFATSVFMIAGTLTVYLQLDYMRSKNLGIDISRILIIRGPGALDSTYQQKIRTFKSNLVQLSAISHVANSTMIPGKEITWINNSVKAKTKGEDLHSIPFIGVGDDFIPTFNLEIIAGRNFDQNRPDENRNVLLTRASAKILGFERPEDAIEEVVIDSNQEFKVVGVLEDFHQRSMKHSFSPIIFRYVPGANSFFVVKIDSKDIRRSIADVEEGWDIVFKDRPFEYFFLDDYFDQQYREDLQFGQVFGLFSGLAILIACLGLFGLVVFISKQRTSEIGVRKVLGASVSSIFRLLISDFIILVVIASLVALPFAWFGFNNWLDGYAFRIEIGWWFVFYPILMILVITLLTSGWQTAKAAMTNPIDSIRYE